MPADPASEYRAVLIEHEKGLRDLAHEVGLAKAGGSAPPWVHAAMSNAILDCVKVLNYYRGMRVPSELHEELTDVLRGIARLARALDQ